MANRLENKIAVITGGGGGIGSAAGKIFCEEGARVALVDQNPDAVEAAAADIRARVPGADVRAYVADLSIESEAGRVVAEIVAAFGGIDVLANNAGIRRYEAVADAPWETWDAIVKVNLLSYVSMTRAALPYLRASGRGAIVNTSSAYGLYPRKGMGAYDATKAAILSLTRTLACEEVEHGIRVNAVCPGFTVTPFHVQRLGAEVIAGMHPPCLMGRWGAAVEVAWPMLWLASNEASYVTGTTIMIDGGLPI